MTGPSLPGSSPAGTCLITRAVPAAFVLPDCETVQFGGAGCTLG